MKPRDHDPSRLDVEAFAKEGAALEGRWLLAQFGRLAESAHPEWVPSGSDAVRWSVRGERRQPHGAAGQSWLHVRADAVIQCACQRCLQAMETPLVAERSFLFVAGEAAAAELDSEIEDDVLALTDALDLRELLEDEFLLAMPLVPRHEICPESLLEQVQAVANEESAPHPFAALAQLKRGKLPS